MRVPLSWLREYVAVDLDPEALAVRLTQLGMEVQGIERIGADWEGIVVGELLEVAPHPTADRLSLTRVRTAPDGPQLAIVCGATNIAAGQRVPVALPGAVLPGGRAIGRAEKMGVVSEGMLCSGDELRLTGDAEGILILPADSPLGRPLGELYGDVVLDVDVKPNRGDALSIVGLAREVAAATGGDLRLPAIAVRESGDETAAHLQVEVLDPGFCTRFVGRYLDGVTVGPSPLWVQLRLTAAGQRPVSNVVDASNYVMLELGKPVHTFDAAAIPDGRLTVRMARPGERLETLDHVVRELTADTGLIAGRDGPLAIGGVMGGATSEVGDSTRTVVIESAIFDPVSIRRTAQRYGLRSEASLRFEKGLAHVTARTGADRTAQLILAWAGGRAARGAVDSDPAEPPPSRVAFRPARVSRLLGVEVPAGQQRELLARVEITTEPASPGQSVPVAAGLEVPLDAAAASEALVAIVPAHRRDLQIEADLAEEVARVRGYETVPGALPATPMPPYRPDPRSSVDLVRDLLAGRGLTEVVTHALIAPQDHARLGIDPRDPQTIRVANPVSADHAQLRRSLLPGLLQVIAVNEGQRRPDMRLFEVGATHRLADGVPEQAEWLGLAAAGAWQERAPDQERREADLEDLKGLVTWLASRLGLPTPAFTAAGPLPGVEHPGRIATIVLPGGGTAGAPRQGAGAGDAAQVLGRVGELDPRYVAATGVRAERVAFALIDLAVLLAASGGARRITPWPRVPAVERDLALIVPLGQPAGDVEALIRAEAGELLRELRLFDRYEGPPLGAGELSLAYRLRLQAADRTLTDEDVDALLERLVVALGERLGARLRG